MYGFALSLMCMDLRKFTRQIEFLNGVADFFHVDIMDGHFVPNITLSPLFIENVSRLAKKPIDAHLMVERPELLTPLCLDAGAGYVSVHPETVGGKVFRLIDAIRAKGAKFGISLNPETSIAATEYYIGLADKVTVMTVDPGFSGGAFVRTILRKIETLRDLREKEGFHYSIEVDGSCNEHSFHDLAAAGAEIFVLGNTGLFGLDPDIETAWKRMKEKFDAAVADVGIRG